VQTLQLLQTLIISPASQPILLPCDTKAPPAAALPVEPNTAAPALLLLLLAVLAV
jgi:hypothetical protein